MQKDFPRKCANVTSEMINIFLSLCETFKKKKVRKGKSGFRTHSLHRNEQPMSSKPHRYAAQDDRGFRCIIIYQDHVTKFFYCENCKKKD